MRDPRHIAVIGVTGYTGYELATLLLRHPVVSRPTFYVRDTKGAKCLSELFPQLRGWGEAPLKPLSFEAVTANSAGTAFLATPHEVSAEIGPKLARCGFACDRPERGIPLLLGRNVLLLVQAARSARRRILATPCTACRSSTATAFPGQNSSPIPAAMRPA